MKKKPSTKSEVFYMFVFRKFKTPNQIGPTYSAKYTPDSNLVITGNIIDLKSGSSEEFHNKDAWELFDNYVTFEEIFNPFPNMYFYTRNNIYEAAVKRQEAHKALPDPPDLFLLKTVEEMKDANAKYKKQMLQANAKYEKQMLQAIGENPVILSCFGKNYNDATETLIRILSTARWSTNKKEAKEAKYLLLDYLIPGNPGGKRQLPSSKTVQLIMDLTKRLAQHLSEKCKKEMAYSRTEYPTSELKEGIRNQLKGISDLRIRNLSISDLQSLILKPATYAKELVEAQFDTSTKTIRRNR